MICETAELLNPAHPDNGDKAAFFVALGFGQENWQTLATAFGKLAENGLVVKSMETMHGQKYILEGRIETPVGKPAQVRTVWIVDRGLDRLVWSQRIRNERERT